MRCFFFDCDDARYGRIGLSFDTQANNLENAKDAEQRTIRSRRRKLRGPDAWRSARHGIRHPLVEPIVTNGGDFAHGEFDEVSFPEWTALAERGYPRGDDEHEDDYLKANARLVMWRTAERLVAGNAFAPLPLASPFLVGYSLADGEETILRILNWPG